MARITSYPVLSTVSSGDWIPITDTSVTGNPLKNVTVGSLQGFILESATLQSVVTAGNTYQGSSGPLWTWDNSGLRAASSGLSTFLSDRVIMSIDLSNKSYTEITPAQVELSDVNGNSSFIGPNLSLTSDVSLQMPNSSGVLALATDIPWVPVVGGINYPTGRVGVNTSVPTSALHVTGGMTVTDSILCPIFKGALRGTIESNTLAITQSTADNSTKVATTAFVANAVGTIPSGLTFRGNWNAENNEPNLSTIVTENGDFWIVSVPGTTNLGGITDWQVGDWAISVYSGPAQTWQKIDNSSVLTGTGTGQKIAKWDGSGTSLTLTDSIITENINGVGIGTTNPTEKLEVSGGIKGNALFLSDGGDHEVKLIAGNITAFHTFTFPDTEGTLAITSDIPSASQWDDVTGGINYANGNVGIGTITPAAQLETTENIIVKGMTVGVGAYVPPPQVTGGTTVIGVDALPTTTGGVRSTAIGHSALKSITSGSSNTAIGSQAMEFSTVVTNATAVGALALQDGIGTYGSVAIGSEALRFSTLSTGTVAVGTKAGRLDSTNANVTRADQSIFIGQETKPLGNNEINQIVIGNSAIGLGSNTVVLGKAATTKTRLYGNVGIGTDTPASSLDVADGDVEVSQIASGIILKSPDGTRYRVTVANGGALAVTAV